MTPKRLLTLFVDIERTVKNGVPGDMLHCSVGIEPELPQAARGAVVWYAARKLLEMGQFEGEQTITVEKTP